jgi:hypothetical protein
MEAWLRKIKEKDHLEKLNVDGRVIKKLVLNRMRCLGLVSSGTRQGEVSG